MIVWSRAPPSASCVPRVCRKRWALTVPTPLASTSPVAVQTIWNASSNNELADISFPRRMKP